MVIFEGLDTIGGTIFLLCALLGWYWIYSKRSGYWYDKPIPSQSPLPIPFVGPIVQRILSGNKIHDIDINLCSKYGRVFGSYNGKTPLIYVADPDLIKLILVKDFSSFTSRRVFTTGNPIVDNMVSNIKGGEQWKNIRNTITPAFSSGKIKNMLPLVSDCAKLTVDNFDKYSREGEPVDCRRLYGNYTLDVIANVAFGTQLDSHNDPDNQFVYHAKRVFSTEINWKLVLSIALPKLGRIFGTSVFKEDTIDFFKELTLEIIRRREANNEVRNDFLQILMDSLKEDSKESDPKIDGVANIKRKPLTMDEVIAQTVIFFLAGYDTTANTLTSVTYYLATNPECQKKAMEEVDRIWENRKTIDVEALFEAKYIGAAIDEALRLFPPATKVMRTCVKDYKLGNTGVIIPVGMLVQIPSYLMHHDPELFPDPEEFKPERFLSENKTKIANSYTYLPFGAGPRSCVAMRLALMEIKLCLLYVLRKFQFSPSEKTKVPLEFINSVLLQPKDVILYVNKRR